MQPTQEAPRLAAVVFTDVVGYSARMQQDEAGTIAQVREDFARMRELCAAESGEVLNTMGDGMMLAFSSAVQAVRFAQSVQAGFAGREGGLQHRVGIHVGDVVRVDGHLAGDGVNIAARLEGKAPSGGICISQAVHDMVKGKLALDASFAGSQVFKNIAQPVPVWLVGPGSVQAAAALARPLARRRRKLLLGAAAGGVAAAAAGAGGFFMRPAGEVLHDERSIAVLPFANMGGDKDSAYFADGVHEDLLTQLALLGQLKVVSRTSVMEYRNTVKKIPQIARELGVGALVEGSVRRAGNQVRVTAQLLDAKSDKHMWAANYDRDLKDVFKVQSELATEIARALKVSLSASEEARLSRPPTTNLQAYDLYLRHEALVRSVAGSLRVVSSLQERIGLLEQAVSLDPAFALAWARLGAEHARAKGFGFGRPGEHMGSAQRAISRAVALAADDPQVKIQHAVVFQHALQDYASAMRSYREVLAQAPYNVEALTGLAEVLNAQRRDVEAIPLLDKALTVDARNGAVLTRLAGTYGRYRHFDRALELRKRVVDLRPDNIDLRAGLEMWTYWKTGTWNSYDAWRATLPSDSEQKSARVRNADAARAIARGDFAEVHRLIDIDVADFRQSLTVDAESRAELAAAHALAWHAAGDSARARSTATDALRAVDAAMGRVEGELQLWQNKANMHAILRQRDAALGALDKAIEQSKASSDPVLTELFRSRRPWLHALLGETHLAVSMLKEEVGKPGFFIHELNSILELVPLRNHPDFVKLVKDPATNAPLPLDTPLTGRSR